MGIYLNPGNGKFKITTNSKIYVDKTELIKETNQVINTEQRFVCVSRPRRFGKSIAANMLVAYYDRSCDSAELFANYKISKKEEYQKHLNQYNVIALNMQTYLSRAKNIKNMLAYFQSGVIEELKEMFPNVVLKENIFLGEALEKIYSKTGEQFIFVIDEWDCVLREKGFSQKDYTEYLDYLRNLLKDQVYVALAYMTGILPIKKYGSHSALNMFFEYSMTNPNMFEEYVGFTETEVLELCREYKMDLEEMMNWYDGYSFETFQNDMATFET